MVLSGQSDTVTFPPSDLWSDEPPLESDRHLKQIVLLLSRKSWGVWEEDGKYPNLILEIFSDTTAQIDKGLKKQIYQDIFRTPEYFWFDPYSFEFKGFRLKDARYYEEIAPTEQGWLWSQQLKLYLGIVEERLRFFTPEGELVPAPKEAAIQEQQRSSAERQRALSGRGNGGGRTAAG